MATLLWVGCDTTHAPFMERHRGEGWRVALNPQEFSSNRVHTAIVADYKNYIATLSPEEQREAFETRMRLLEDRAGGQAIEISIPVAGFWSAIWWEHTLVYDPSHKRLKTLKYKSGRSVL